MKTDKILCALLCSGVALTLGSCSLLDKIKGEENVKKEVVLPQDREQILKDKTAKTYTPEELGRGVVKGDWAIEKVDGKDAVGQETPFLRFVPEEKRVYGNNGCNVVNATYQYSPADSTLSFGEVATTMKMCNLTGITDYEINAALDATRRYSWELRGSQYYLFLKNEAGRTVMELMHQDFQFLNGTWRVAAINDQPVSDPEVKLVIDVDEGKLHGNTGCNILNGAMDIDMETPNSISFSAIATTRMACPEGNYQTGLLVALEDATSARPISADKVLLLDSQRHVVLELVRESAR